MRLSEFERVAVDVFGSQRAAWVLHSHHVSGLGMTANDAIARGVDPREVWDRLVMDFDIPEELRFGLDD